MVFKEDRVARFNSRIKVALSGCHEWTGSRYASGYGQFWWGAGKNMKASRAAWLLFRGDIADGLMVLHKCHNRACCNPDHLYLGDHAQNMVDRREAGRTSRGSHRHNFRRSPDLIQQIKEAVPHGQPLKAICGELGIGWQTMYRAIQMDDELARLVKQTKAVRYRNAALERAR